MIISFRLCNSQLLIDVILMYFNTLDMQSLQQPRSLVVKDAGFWPLQPRFECPFDFYISYAKRTAKRHEVLLMSLEISPFD